MTFSWSNTNIGGKAILISSLVAIISIFLPWVDLVIRYTNGFQELTFVLLAFFVYPTLQVIKNKPISLLLGSASSILAAVAAVAFMEWKTIPYQGVNLCFAGQGTYLFFVASVILFAGVLKYKASELEVSEKSPLGEQ
jgi:hypothetical protein